MPRGLFLLLFAALGSIAGMGLAYLPFVLDSDDRESSAVFLFPFRQLTADDPTIPQTAEAVCGGYLNGSAVVERLIERNDLASLPSFRHEADLNEAIRSNLRFRPIDADGPRFEVRFSATRGEDADRVVAALLELHRTEFTERLQNADFKVLEFLREAEVQLNQDLARQRKVLRDYRAVSPPVDIRRQPFDPTSREGALLAGFNREEDKLLAGIETTEQSLREVTRKSEEFKHSVAMRPEPFAVVMPPKKRTSNRSYLIPTLTIGGLLGAFIGLTNAAARTRRNKY
jgi:hypothetical protein